MIRRRNIFLLVLWASPALADVTIADFETPRDITASSNLTADRVESDSPQGQSHLRLKMKSDGIAAGLIRLPLISGVLFQGHERLTAQVRIGGSDGTKVLRWLAIDRDGRPIFQRRFELRPGETWVRIDEPLRNWRWHDANAGDWSEVRELGLRIESPTDTVEVDDIRLTGMASEAQRTQWLLEMAFEDRAFEHMQESGVLVATDAVDAFEEPDLRKLVDDMLDIRAWVKRVFGDAVRPIDGEGPAILLIFASNDDRQAFFRRLGGQWRATLAAPTAQGFTVQDIASSTYDPAQGVRRPVYLHESVHAIVARELRLPTGYPSTSPLQEGLANYLQLCVYPQALDPRTYVINFGRPIDPAGTSFFKPLRTLFGRRAESANYAQLASFVAYLVERDPPLLRALTRGLADGHSADDVLESQQTDWPAVEKAWIEWGQERFNADRANPAAFFDVPQEFH